MKPNVQQDEVASGQAPSDSGPEASLRRAMRALHRCYERTLAGLAEAVCDAEETLDQGGEFVLSEIENKYLHRMRDLQMAICSLRNRLTPTRTRTASVDDLRCSDAELASTLSTWLGDHPDAEIVQVLLRQSAEGEVQVLPVYYPPAQ